MSPALPPTSMPAMTTATKVTTVQVTSTRTIAVIA